jgi:poly(A) polymerase
LFQIKPYERKIFELIQLSAKELGFPVYVVGGYVRDRLLNRPSKDMDIVCVGSGIDLAQQLASHLRPIPRIVTYKRFGTALIKHTDMEIEFVGARKESYSPSSRKPAVEKGSLQDDLNRRDFTINALAVSLNENNYGQIIDPFKGLQHLEDKLLITPLEPGKTFSDDPLRMMRAIRFSNQLDFKIDPQTFRAIKLYKERIRIVSKERITVELQKIMDTATPSVGFKLLEECELLPIILPELSALRGVEVQKGYGHKDNFFHTLQVLDNVARVSKYHWLRWAALLHDIAKPATKRFDPDTGWSFHGHEVVGAKMVPKIFKNLRLPLDHKMRYVQKMVRLHLRPVGLAKEEISDAAIRRLLFDAGEDIDDLMMLCRADITSKNDNKVKRIIENYNRVEELMKEVEEKDRLRNWQPPVTGQMIMEIFDLNPGEMIGILKTAIREAILEGNISNDREEAISYLLKIGKQHGLSPNIEKIDAIMQRTENN